jgi:hypothetical protein
VAGAQRYAAERAGEPERYTKHAAGWIRDERWKDPPPAGAVIDQHGNVVALVEQGEASGENAYEMFLRALEEEPLLRW